MVLPLKAKDQTSILEVFSIRIKHPHLFYCKDCFLFEIYNLRNPCFALFLPNGSTIWKTFCFCWKVFYFQAKKTLWEKRLRTRWWCRWDSPGVQQTIPERENTMLATHLFVIVSTKLLSDNYVRRTNAWTNSLTYIYLSSSIMLFCSICNSLLIAAINSKFARSCQEKANNGLFIIFQLCLCFLLLIYFILLFYFMTMFLCEELWVCLMYEKCYMNKVALPSL